MKNAALGRLGSKPEIVLQEVPQFVEQPGLTTCGLLIGLLGWQVFFRLIRFVPDCVHSVPTHVFSFGESEWLQGHGGFSHFCASGKQVFSHCHRRFPRSKVCPLRVRVAAIRLVSFLVVPHLLPSFCPLRQFV